MCAFLKPHGNSSIEHKVWKLRLPVSGTSSTEHLQVVAAGSVIMVGHQSVS